MVRIDPKYQKRQKNMGAGLGNSPLARLASCTRKQPIILGFPLGKTIPFHTNTPFSIPLTQNSIPKLIHLITNIKRHSKPQQTID